MLIPVHEIDTSEITDEARRQMTVCNACRYCEGFCPVFPEMTNYRDFERRDLSFLAHLCHGCSACFHACQYKPPHEFSINVPEVMAKIRLDDYSSFVWPSQLSGVMKSNGTFISLSVAIVLSAMLLLAFTLIERSQMYEIHVGAGAFYQIFSHGLIVALAGGSLIFAVLALTLGIRRFVAENRSEGAGHFALATLYKTMMAAIRLDHLSGGQGQGCNDVSDSPSHRHKYFHHALAWGFGLCFAATSVATFYELALGWISPFPIFSAPVILGSIGGIGILIGGCGLLWLKHVSDPSLQYKPQFGMDYAFILLLVLISLTGFGLLLLRETAWMGTLMAVHLGVVLAFFLTLPYSKFVHAIFRCVALYWYYDRAQKMDL